MLVSPASAREIERCAADPRFVQAMGIWKSMFDCFHGESKFGGTYVPFQFHPYISGRPGRAATLQSIIAQAGDLIESRSPELLAAARAALTLYNDEALGQAE